MYLGQDVIIYFFIYVSPFLGCGLLRGERLNLLNSITPETWLRVDIQ